MHELKLERLARLHGVPFIKAVQPAAAADRYIFDIILTTELMDNRLCLTCRVGLSLFPLSIPTPFLTSYFDWGLSAFLSA